MWPVGREGEEWRSRDQRPPAGGLGPDGGSAGAAPAPGAESGPGAEPVSGLWLTYRIS